MLSDGRKIARFHCCNCSRYFTAKHEKKNNLDSKQIIQESLERSSVRILARRYKTGKRQIEKIIHEGTSKIKNSIWIAKNLKPCWGNILVFDGKYIRVYDKITKQLKDKGKFSEQEIKSLNRNVWLCGIDYSTGDLPHYSIATEESKIDLVMYFKTLKEEIGYNLQFLVCDGNEDIASAARFVYGDKIIVQQCTRHFVEKLKAKAGEKKENIHIQNIINLIQRIIEAENLEQAGKYLSALKKQKIKTPIERMLIEDFKKHKIELTQHLFLKPQIIIPHTSNDIENLFRQLNLRIKTINRFNYWQYARDYLQAWAYLRRTTPFTDCKSKERKKRNGKAPLELAGVDLKKLK